MNWPLCIPQRCAPSGCGQVSQVLKTIGIISEEEVTWGEMKEETGLDVSIDGLLYVTDRIQNNSHVVIISFLVSKKRGKLGTGDGPEFARGKIRSVKMIPLNELRALGFSTVYSDLAKSGFPDKGSYKGNILND